jgi:hypothetical protein
MTSESSDLPRFMRALGWGLAGLTLLYPWEAVYAWHQVHDLLATETQSVLQGAGAFDLRTSTIHCGPLGWLGGVATFVSLIWLLAALVAWVGRRRRGERPLATPSRLVVGAVLGAVLLAFGTQQYFARVHGVHIL